MIKTLLVHLEGFESDHSALETAHLLARAFHAHMECVHARPSALELAVSVSSLQPELIGPASAKLWESLEEQSQSRAAAARRMFDRLCAREGLPSNEQPSSRPCASAFYRQTEGKPVRKLTDLSRRSDVVVIGRPEPASSFDVDAIGEVLFGAGRPVLLTTRKSPKAVGTCVAIAWKETAEAARAVHDSIPILVNARKVVILAAAEGTQDVYASIASAESLAASLRWHGIDSEARCVVPDAKGVHEAVLETASEMSADLLVMGAYGHSRMRELIFGGFTRAVLNEASLPVFLSH